MQIPTFAGPLGRETEIENFGTVLCIGGCYGIGSVYPIARALKEKGNTIYTILEARSSYLLYWQERFKAVSERVIEITRDGTSGYKGHLTRLPEILTLEKIKPDRVIVNGCTFQMMKVVGGHQAAGHQDHGQHEPDHDRRHRHVRRLPSDGGRYDQIRLRGRSGL